MNDFITFLGLMPWYELVFIGFAFIVAVIHVVAGFAQIFNEGSQR